MLVRLLAKLFINPINIPLRLLANLFINPINVPFPFSNSQQALKTPHRINSIGLTRRTPSVSST